VKQAVVVADLHKAYGTVRAIDGVSFEVEAGEIFGMVGPNGAGKTTTIECIEGLRTPDRGSVQVLGLEPLADAYEMRERIGVQLQQASLPDRLKVWEAIDVFASFYRESVDWTPILKRMGLEEKRGAYISKLSGGQKQRLFIALALVNDPELVFLDELTTGLDPQARRSMWDLVRSIRDAGSTVFLTTHFMEEAELLCDRVAIMDAGKIVALDTPRALIESIDAENRVSFLVDEGFDPTAIRDLACVTRLEVLGERAVVYGHGDALVSEVVGVLQQAGGGIRDLRTEQPTLEDVFLTLTGRQIRE
jgi:ABC-2 type transport system ATP-binding protein